MEQLSLLNTESRDLKDLLRVLPPNSHIQVFLSREGELGEGIKKFVLYVDPRPDPEGQVSYTLGLSGGEINQIRRNFMSEMGLRVTFSRRDGWRSVKTFFGPTFTDPTTGRWIFKVQVKPTEGDSFVEVLRYEDCYE